MIRPLWCHKGEGTHLPPNQPNQPTNQMNISYYYVPCTSGIAGEKGVDLGNCINPKVVVITKADGTMVKKGSYSDVFAG